MSLTDALLLEGYRDPHCVHIALRPDGQFGSGTIDDPFDGGTRFGPTLAATFTCNRRELVVGGVFAHNLQPGDPITISGATGPNRDWFNGTFTVQEVTELQFMLVFTKMGLPSGPPGVQYGEAISITGPNGPIGGLRFHWPVAKITAQNSVLSGLAPYGAVDVAGDDTYAGSYVALAVDTPSPGTSFRCRLSYLPSNDITGSPCTVTRRIHRFDEVRRSLPSNSVIRLGPGTFETRGYCSVYSAKDYPYWDILHVGAVLRSGQRLLGAGLDTTVVRLVLPIDELTQTSALATALATEQIEVADLTVDCNSPNHPAPFGIFPTPVTCGAVALTGSYLSARRVRAINFCVQSRPECFVIALLVGSTNTGPVPGDFNVIEDCIVEQPGAPTKPLCSVARARPTAGFVPASRAIISTARAFPMVG